MFFFVIFTVAGTAVAVYGAVTIVTTRRFLGSARRTEGMIIGWNVYSHGIKDSDEADYPVLRFRAPDGRIIETEAQYPLSHRPGEDEPVEVLFDPDAPHRARIPANGGRGYLFGVIFLIGGLVMAIAPSLLALT